MLVLCIVEPVSDVEKNRAMSARLVRLLYRERNAYGKDTIRRMYVWQHQTTVHAVL
jgi:hypothetical protein